MKNIKYLLLLLSFQFLIACDQASDAVIGIPNVTLQCESQFNATCETTNNGNNAFVIMSRSGCDESMVDYEPIATGSVAMSCDAVGCSGTISSWSDSNSNTVTEIQAGPMDVCSRFDIGNNDAAESIGDLINEENYSIQSSSTITVGTWRER